MGSLRASTRFALPILAMFLTPLTNGCLITDPIDIPQEENVPPSIVSDNAAPEPRYPIEQIVTLDRDVDESLRFDVIVRDPNLDDELEWAVYYNFEAGGANTILVPGRLGKAEELERPLFFELNDLTRFTRGLCHKIELRVSRDLQADGFPPPPPEDVTDPPPLDLAVAVWWINSLSEDGTPTDLATCPD